jgi:hypothetical protein
MHSIGVGRLLAAGKPSSSHRRTQSLGLTYATGVGANPVTPRSAETAKTEAAHADVAAAALSSVTTSAAGAAFGGLSLNRLIATGLYQGISSHIRQFTVSDSGSLIFKRDVSAFRDAVDALIKLSKNHLERRAIAMQFDTLREVANLLIVPLDNIKSVRSSGLLRYLHKEETQQYVNMRADVGRLIKMSS